MGLGDLAGDEARRAENADAERAADDDGEAEADAEDADETAGRGRSGASDVSIISAPATLLRLERDEHDVDAPADVARRVARAARFELDVAALPPIHVVLPSAVSSISPPDRWTTIVSEPCV